MEIKTELAVWLFHFHSIQVQLEPLSPQKAKSKKQKAEEQWLSKGLRSGCRQSRDIDDDVGESETSRGVRGSSHA